jgi:hypothetical protein
MTVTECRAGRYRERAEECLQIAANSLTPGTGETHRMLAERYFQLAQKELREARESHRELEVEVINGARL